MPTAKQIDDAWKAVKKISPDVRIHNVGPEGVTFQYPTVEEKSAKQWEGRPFAAKTKR